MSDQTTQTLGDDREVYRFDDAETCFQLTLNLVRQANRSIKLLSRDLERGFYDRPEIVDAFSEFARLNRFAEVLILVADVKPLITNTHALVTLLGRLPSKIKLRVLNPDYPNATNAWLLADRHGLMYRKEPSIYSGFVNFADAGHVQQFSDNFDAMWQRANESIELRRLNI